MALNCPTCNPSRHAMDQDPCSLCIAQLAPNLSTIQALCPDCHQPLQLLEACGAVDYFCQYGHGLNF